MNYKNRHRRSILRVIITLMISIGIYLGYRLLRRHEIGVHELLLTDGNPRSLSVFSILAYSLVFGLKHALEPDHLAAVSTIAIEHKSLAGSSLVGAVWGVGHTLSLLLAGLIVILLGYDLREEYLTPVKVIVALMLIGLGLRSLWVLWRERKAIVITEQRETLDHYSSRTDHSNNIGAKSIWDRIGFRPLLIGMVHGLAGSAALLLLLIPVIPSATLKIVYILVFGIGSIAGMIMMSCMVGLPTHLMAERFLKLSLVVRSLAGLFSFGFGVWLLWEFVRIGQ